jgi:deoxyribonucleoside regulator
LGAYPGRVRKKVDKKELNKVKIVQLKGGLPHMEEVDRLNEITRLFAEAYRAETHFLPLPLLVDSKEIKEAIIKDKNIQAVLKLGSNRISYCSLWASSMLIRRW